MKNRLLVVGARKKSLGASIAKMWSDMYDAPVTTLGISGEEDIRLGDLEAVDGLNEVLGTVRPTHMVCTVGINEELGDKDFEYWFKDHMNINAYLPMRLLMTWLEHEEAGPTDGSQFVAISSNSAHIPRSRSMAYGASKAALSMAIRCAARDVARAGIPMSIYGYEPGLIKGTPMSGERGGTRMEGQGLGQGLSRRNLAGQIAHNLVFGGPELNGTLHRIDAGEV